MNLDQMGLGKSAQALIPLAVDPEKLLPAVVIGPAAVFYN
jgi:SNF2 family DNA or RNA helicase